MSNQLAEALVAAGVAQAYHVDKPKGSYHQQFTFPVTRFEFPIFIKVECEKVEQGLKFISSHSLNDIPENANLEQAKEMVEAKLDNWFREPVPTKKNGMLRYWKFL